MTHRDEENLQKSLAVRSTCGCPFPRVDELLNLKVLCLAHALNSIFQPDRISRIHTLLVSHVDHFCHAIVSTYLSHRSFVRT